MKKNILKYFLLIISFLALIVIYLSIIGLETKKFNNQIQDKVFQTNKNLKIELKTIKLTLDPLKFKINVKTIGPKIFYKTKNLELEYIKTQISLTSVLKNKFVSSKLELSTKAILFKDLVTFIRAITNKPELFIVEKIVKKGQLIIDVELNFDENGNIKKDYQIKTILKNGRVELSKNYNFEKINFSLNIKNNNFNFKDINFTNNKIKFFLNNLIITQNKNNFLLKGEIQNNNSILSDELQKLINSNFENFNLSNTSFSSKNKFSFNVDNKFKMNNLDITSYIKINRSDYLKPISFNDYFPDLNNFINIKDHKINLKYKKNNLTINGYGKVKLEKNYNNIEYTITNKKNIFNINSKVDLSELKLKNQEFLKPFFPKLKEITSLKDQLIEINYSKDNLLIKGLGKIKLENEFEDIRFLISKVKDKFSFDTKINLENTSLNIDYLNFKKDEKSKTELIIVGNFNNQKGLNFDEINIKDKNNKIVLENLLLDKDNLIIKIDKIDLDYFDTENRKNKFSLLRKQKNSYEIKGSLFNANKLIDNLLKNKNNDESKILKSDISLNLELNEVYVEKRDTIKNLRGKLDIKNNKIIKANISAIFDKNRNFTFTINTNDNGEKITTFNSSNAKPIVKRYDFIKGFEGGSLDFSSTKKDDISNSVLIIDDFKVQEVPVLAKLLSLASLQGIADLLTGEGVRFTNFEMIFSNNKNLMTIEELYAIGPSISLLIDGYIENNKLISLRGTLVPATTINRSIASIPMIGDLLIGKKAGEGVFGVSFKIKGSPKDLKTTVNPIKTLTPRFITRTLEKIKKN